MRRTQSRSERSECSSAYFLKLLQKVSKEASLRSDVEDLLVELELIEKFQVSHRGLAKFVALLSGQSVDAGLGVLSGLARVVLLDDLVHFCVGKRLGVLWHFNLS